MGSSNQVNPSAWSSRPGGHRLDVGVAARGVLHQREVGPGALARRVEPRDVALQAVPELDLEAAIALGPPELRLLEDLFGRRVDRAGGRVARDPLPSETQERGDGLPEGLASQVPQRDVERADRGVARVVHVPLLAPEVLPDRLDVARVTADDVAGIRLVQHVSHRPALAQAAVLHRMAVDAGVRVERDERDPIRRVEDALGRVVAPGGSQVVREDPGRDPGDAHLGRAGHGTSARCAGR